MLKQSLVSPAQPQRAETRLFPGGVFATLRGSTYGTNYDSPLRSLRPCLEQGASQGEEAVLANPGREGDIPPGLGG